ncbi:MAG: hypothetical protein ACXAC8_06285 [Candidatus Hodarchaeales archaeon]|jgi:hypothetical protein
MVKLEKNIGQTITLSGIAKEAKGGPVVITIDNNVIYVKGLDSWSPDLVNNRVSVKGVLKKEQFIPHAKIDENGGISSGATGDQYVLELIALTEATN